MSLVITYYGEEKTGKTTFGFTCPKPMLHLDFDLGRERAIWRFKDADQIISIPLPEPPNWAIGSGAATKLWATFEAYYEKGLADPQMKTIFIDTGTQMWKANTQEYLENYVKRSNPKRQQLQQIEYRMPNDRMRAKVLAARGAGKLLVISHYESDIYEERFVQHPDGTVTKESVPTGQKRHSGFGDITYLTDLHLRLTLHNVNTDPITGKPQNPIKLRPFATVETPNPLSVYGYEFAEPSYDRLMQTIEIMRNAEMAGVSTSSTVTS